MTTHLPDFIHESSVHDFNILFQKGLEKEAKGEINLIVENKAYPVYVSLTTLYPKLQSVGMVVSDLKERKAHEQTLAQNKMLEVAKKAIEDSEKRYNMMLMQSPFAFAVFSGRDLIITLANDRMKEVLGKGADIENKPLLEVLPELIGQPFAGHMYTVLETGVPFSANEALARLQRNGQLEEAYFNFVYQPYWEVDGSISGVTCIAYEVTNEVIAKKKIEESEKRFRNTFYNNMVPMAVWTAEGGIINANDALLDMLGYTRNELESGQIKWTDITPPHFAQRDTEAVTEVLTKGSCTPYEKIFLHKSGYPVPILIGGGRFDDSNKSGLLFAIDLTARNKAEDQLKESERQLKQITEAIPQMVWVCNDKGEVIYFNQGWYTYTGTVEKDMMGHRWVTLVHPDDASGALEKWNYAQQTLTPVSVEYRLKSAEGEYHWVLSKGVPILGENGALQKWFGACTFIDEQKEFSSMLEQKVAERTIEILRQKEFSETIINTTMDLIGVYDTQMRIITFNKACQDALNIKNEDVIGKVYTDVFPAAKGSAGQLDLKRALDGEIIHNPIYYSPILEKYYENIVTPLKDDKGNVYAAVAIAHDITESINAIEKIKQSEEKFNTLFQLSPLALALLEFPSGNFVSVNEAYENLLEYKNEELIGKNNTDLDILNSHEREKIIQYLSATGAYKNIEVTLKTKSKHEISILASSQVIHIGSKKFYLSAITDITTRKTSELEIAQKNMDLEKMNKELQSFAYISSHDLQEPLRKIQLFSNRIQEKEYQNLSATGKEYFERMRLAARRMQILINDLLAYSRTSTIQGKQEKTSLSKILNEVKEDIQEELTFKKATIEAEDLCEINVIPFQFRQVLQNLISNSLKYCIPDQPPHIVIKSEIKKGTALNNKMLLPENTYCHIAISDNGIGFEPQYSEKIFEVFQRLHAHNEYTGTGVGLSIVKKIIENHKGYISATSQSGKGATFDIFIPANGY